MTPSGAYIKAIFANKRLPELEYIIMNDAWHTYYYAKDVIKGRWIEAEDIIMASSYDSWRYSRDIIKCKLPEKMHNMMLLHGIKDPNDWCIKEYFEYIK